MINLSRLPVGAKYLVLGLVVGAAYSVGMSSVWGFKVKSTESTRAARGSKEAVRPRVVCFGDSLTQFGFDAERLGWLALLSHWWERRYDVINRGFSGYNTRWLMPLVDKLFVPGGAAATKLVTIFLGANDCVLPGNAQYVPIEEYKANLEHMVRHVWKAHPEARVLLITPPPIHEGKWAEHRSLQDRDLDRKQEVTKSYAKACIEVGEELSVKVIDTYTIMGAGDPSLADMYLHDGVHFTSEGNRKLFEAIQGEIKRSFPELDPAYGGDATMQAPHWSNVDPAKPSDSVLQGL